YWHSSAAKKLVPMPLSCNATPLVTAMMNLPSWQTTFPILAAKGDWHEQNKYTSGTIAPQPAQGVGSSLLVAAGFSLQHYQRHQQQSRPRGRCWWRVWRRYRSQIHQ